MSKKIQKLSFKNEKNVHFSSFSCMILRKKKFFTCLNDNFRTCFVLKNINFQNKDFN